LDKSIRVNKKPFRMGL